MTLHDYLTEHRLTPSEFGGKVGTSGETIRRYILGLRTPRPQIMRKISEVTNGAVTANDFMPPSAGEAA